jgi:hypothetical protein
LYLSDGCREVFLGYDVAVYYWVRVAKYEGIIDPGTELVITRNGGVYPGPVTGDS